MEVPYHFMIHISIHKLLYFESCISYHIGKTQYGIIIHNVFQCHMALLYLQNNNLVLQLVCLYVKLSILVGLVSCTMT